MMKTKITLLFLLLLQLSVYCQKQTKTSFMVVPGDNWMTQNGYYKMVDNQGDEEPVFNYKKALLENTDLIPVLTKIEEMLVERGLKVINFQSALNNVKMDNAENAVLSSKTSKSSASESAFDVLMKTAKADVLVKVSWNNRKFGPNNEISFTMEGIDSYTLTPFASITGIGKKSFEASIPILLEEAVLTQIDRLLAKVDEHAADVQENGRKVKIVFKKWDSWAGDFEKEYNGKELNEILEDWFKSNAKNGSFELEESTENKMVFVVRIPLLDENNSALTANGFIRPLNKLLKTPPYSIENKLMNFGLGKAQIMLGEK
jgi:hypothetical protein